MWCPDTCSLMPGVAHSEDFKRALMAGDRNVVYPILHHVLSKFPQLQKRAYVARFLVNVAVPDEFMHDEVVADVHQHYKERQEEFIEVHKRVDRLVGLRCAGLLPQQGSLCCACSEETRSTQPTSSARSPSSRKRRPS